MPENIENKQSGLRVSDLGSGHGRPPEDRRVVGLMHWVRIILPMVLAAFGWYIGTVIGGFNERMSVIESNVQQQEVMCAARASEGIVKFSEIDRRLDAVDSRDIRDHANLIEEDDYIRTISELKQRITDLERSHYQQK